MTATLERQPLGQLLVGSGILQPARLEAALEAQRRSGHQKLLGEILVEMRECTQEQISEALAMSYGLPFARISPAIADPQVMSILPLEFMRSSIAMPLFLVEDVLTIALAEPADVFLVEEIERRAGKQVQIVAATASDILATIDRYQVEGQEFSDGEKTGKHTFDSSEEEFVNDVLTSALRDGAVDVHLEPGEDAFRVRFRIDGRLVEKMRPPVQMHAPIAARLKALAGIDLVEQRLPQEGVGQIELDRRSIDLRVHSMPGPHGEKLLVRLVDSERVTLNIEKLGFSYETLKQWQKLIGRPQGLIVVTGPLGSGKKATLYSALQSRAADDLNICTIEDPVAYAIPGVNQFQVDDAAGLSFASGLRAILRQDADVILIGELRDAETAQLAAQAAMSGQLVFAAMNTVDALGVIPRLLHLGVEPYVLASTLSGVLAQRLVRRLCQTCKQPYMPEGNERREIERATGPGAGNVYGPKGCERCRQLGYAGRLGIFEMLIPDDAMVDAIGRNVPLAELRALAQQAGLKSLRTDALEKTKAGSTSLAEVMRVT